MVKQFSLIIIILASLLSSANAQELLCNVSIEHRRVQGTNTQVFETLAGALTEFMNGRQWTPQKYRTKEKIECTFLINVTAMEGNSSFRCNLTIQARRPVYNSNHSTTLLNYIDKDFNFTYTEYETLEFNENSFSNNLTSMMAYWAYIIIALDNDSFSSLGGTPIFQLAERVVLNAQGKDILGWEANQSSSRRNRFWLTGQMLHTDYENLRKFNYIYHRLGLDIMADQPGRGRKVITDNLGMLKTVHDRNPASFAMQVFFDAKVDELVNMYSPAPFEEKDKVFEILKTVDPGHLSQYQQMKSGF